MPLNFDLEGKSYDPVTAAVNGDEIAAYASASGIANPAHATGADQVAPLVFPVVPAVRALFTAGADPDLGVDNPGMIVHGEQRFRYHQPIRPGDELVMTPVLERVDDRGKHGTFVTRVDIVTSTGEPVVTLWATILVRGAGSGADRAPTPPDPPTRGNRVAGFSSKVDRDMPSRYAAASGDHNPIHLDGEFARAVGLPGVINHGLGTLSLVSAGLVDELAGGDVAQVTDLSCRFTAMVIPGDELTTTVWESPEAGYVFETIRPGGDVAMAGTIRTRDS